MTSEQKAGCLTFVLASVKVVKEVPGGNEEQDLWSQSAWPSVFSVTYLVWNVGHLHLFPSHF